MREKLQEIADELSEELQTPAAVVMESDLSGPLKKGDMVDCSNCGESHPVALAKDADGVESDMLMFIRCGEKSFCVGIAGKRWR